MAFVYRSQRFNESIVKSVEEQNDEQDESVQDFKKDRSMLQKTPIRGLPSLKAKKRCDLETFDRSTLDSMSQNAQTISQLTTKINDVKSKESHMFASKIERKPFKDMTESNKMQKIDEKIVAKGESQKTSKDNSFSSIPMLKNYQQKEEKQNVKKNMKSAQQFAQQKTYFENKKINRNLGKILEMMITEKQPNSLIDSLTIDKRMFQQTKDKSESLNLSFKKKKKYIRVRVFPKKIQSQTLQDFQKQKIILSSSPCLSSKDEPLKTKIEANKIKQLHKLIPKPTKQSSESSEEEDYEKDARPGPGSYDYHSFQKKDFRSKNQKFNKIFVSPIERFKDSNLKFQQVTYVNQENPKKPVLKDLSFLSKSSKQHALYSHNLNPAPGEYETRQSLEHQTVKKLLRSSNSNIFYSNEPRLKTLQKTNRPGPGSYNIDTSKNEEQMARISYTYKSNVERNILPPASNKKTADNDLISICEERSTAIHIKEDYIREDLYYIEPPAFMSGTKRFNELKKEDIQHYHHNLDKNRKYEQPAQRQAFNSSQKRNMIPVVGEGVGVGIYNPQVKLWNKKSYNILFN